MCCGCGRGGGGRGIGFVLSGRAEIFDCLLVFLFEPAQLVIEMFCGLGVRSAELPGGFGIGCGEDGFDGGETETLGGEGGGEQFDSEEAFGLEFGEVCHGAAAGVPGLDAGAVDGGLVVGELLTNKRVSQPEFRFTGFAIPVHSSACPAAQSPLCAGTAAQAPGTLNDFDGEHVFEVPDGAKLTEEAGA